MKTYVYFNMKQCELLFYAVLSNIRKIKFLCWKVPRFRPCALIVAVVLR